MPALVFARAVEMVATISYAPGAGYWIRDKGIAGQLEQHTAMRLLCDWWNLYAPDSKTRCAGYMVPWVRVSDNGQYACGYDDLPSERIESFALNVNGQARIGGMVLIHFMKGAKEFTFHDDGGVQQYSVTGNEGPRCFGVSPQDLSSGDYDEAWYSLEALKGFPRQFPREWKAIEFAAIDGMEEQRLLA
jgi:hypothetical protein